MKNKKTITIISLILALASAGCILFSCLVPLEKLTGFGIDGKLSFFNGVNTAIAVASIIIAIVAIALGTGAKKSEGKSGIRTLSLVISILCIFIGLLASIVVGFLSCFTEFINTEGRSGAVVDMLKENPDLNKTVDEFVKGLQEKANAEKTGYSGVLSAEASVSEKETSGDVSDDSVSEGDTASPSEDRSAS